MLRYVSIAAFGLLLAAATAGAQDSKFPDHPVRIIVSVPAGGGVDTVTRVVAAKMSAVLGQPLPVENKSGDRGRMSQHGGSSQNPAHGSAHRTAMSCHSAERRRRPATHCRPIA